MEREQLVTDIPLPNLEDPDTVDLNSDPENPRVITFEEVKAACERIADGILCTPCKWSHLSPAHNMDIYLKKEFLQVTGSFKERGARNTLLQLKPEQAKRGVIACSLGNHALGLLYHGSLLKIPVTIIMPVNSSLMKQERCRRYGGLVLLKGNNMSESKLYASKIAKLNNLCLINGYDHPHILAGQGTIGIEILEQVPDVDAIIVPVGGGGLLAGICVAVKSIRADVIIIAVESNLCPSFKEAMCAGKPVYTEDCLSSADGLAIPMIGVNSFETARQLVDKVITIDEAYIYRAVIRLLEFEKSVVECSGATSLAVIMANMLPELVGKKVVCILSGGNIDITTLNRVIEKGLAFDGRLCRFVVTLPDKPESIAELCHILKDIGVNVKDISHDRIWSTSSILQVQVKCVCEIRNASHGIDLEHTLKAKYKNVVWN
ncbi:hypothetical protein MN116_000889 [Schistosoma mekongi]|uniref:L-serine deaminase n=1 Tax=Schistosoma mekongi TaxID=38744 RepID=A0AAE2D9X5_SCHME|nr:hypothetical protein MN116_000889 [Schistosoma mekongi]